MKSVAREIINFVESISQKELRKNPKLRRKIKALLKSLIGMNGALDKEKNGVLKYLDKEMLNS